MTLVEVIAASVITSLVAAGTLMALTTAVRLAKRSSSNVQVSHLAQQTLEKFRNRVACDDPWYGPNCVPQPQGGTDTSPAGRPSYVDDWRYAVTPKHMDGDGIADYSEVQVKVSWTPPQ